MSLEIYRKKRQFNKTSEPEGKVLKTNQKELIFVIHEHHASHLHYDLRLEKNGVLKSWAVPKGPPLNSNEKRLAIEVEDHPIEYAKFRGIIPKGNYGAGRVKIWDKGTYMPLISEKKHWKFILKGKKLKGEYSLINTKNKNWLLVKKENKDIKQTVGKMPHEIKPMLATLVDKPFDKENWFFEIKWDGFRAIAEIEKGRVKFYSRNLKSFQKKFPNLVEELKKINHNVVLDGEIVLLDKNGKPNFQGLQNYERAPEGKLVYCVFDILYLDGYDLQNRSLRERKKILREIIPPKSSIIFGEDIEKNGIAFFEAIKKQKLEGVVAKNADSIYQQGIRGPNWLKIKTYLRQEAVICGFTQPRGSREKFGALILGVYERKKLQYIGHTGTGFDTESIYYLFKKLKPLIQKTPPFSQPPKTNTSVTWVKPKLICEVKFQEWTGEGLMRQPVFMGLREDKKLKEIKREIPFLKTEGKYFGGEPPKKNEVKNKILNEGGQNIKISNLDKIFWPEEKYTKGDLINYYKNIADIILLYLKNRPESLLRFPNGIKGKSFFHKDIDFAPSWVKTIKIKNINYLLCQNKETLIYLINLGCIDLNPWNSKIGNLEKPDYMVLDLDPKGASFLSVIKTALVAHQIMESVRIPGYIKTSGLLGMHIYSPLGGKYTYEQARKLAQILAIKINEKLPEITSVERKPEKRKGKVYLDCFQNARGQTLAAPYCVRPIQGACVSTPLDWDEVNNKLSPEQFTIKNMMARIEKKGDLFKPVLGPGLDMEKVLKKLG